jgi:hypothetical protein
MTRFRSPRQAGSRALVLGLAIGLAIVAMSTDASAQCAMCRTMLGSPEGQRMIGALRSGILLLLLAPFAIFATVATLAVRLQRRRHAMEAAGIDLTGTADE